MAKIGRNDPCPCSSGRKYKRCCLDKDRDRALASRTIEPETEYQTADRPDQGISPYVLAKMFESSDEFNEMLRQRPEKARRYWTPGRLADFDTDQIVEGLSGLGLDGSRETFLRLATTTTSAWLVSEQWSAVLGHREVSRFDRDFVGLAACELWKRYCPERPSIEMLDDWMQDGYRRMMVQDSRGACEVWWKVWEVVEARLTPEMTSTTKAAAVFEGTQCLFNWVQDFAVELTNAGHQEPRWATFGARFCRQVLAQFPEESELTLFNFHLDLGSSASRRRPLLSHLVIELGCLRRRPATSRTRSL